MLRLLVPPRAVWAAAIVVVVTSNCIVGQSAATANTERPNIVLILADDLGYGDLASYGAQDLKTPHVDALVEAGIRFSNAYANCPVCSPTRAALLTGRYQEFVGVPGVIRTYPQDNWGFLAADAVMLPTILKAAGYHTACVGKWHLGLESPNIPTDRGFDHFHGFLGDMMDDYYHHRRHGNNYMRIGKKEIDPKGHATDLFSQWSVDYIRARKDEKAPFFLYLAYNAPHTPIQPPKAWLEKVKQRESGINARRAALVALVEHMDHGIGQVIATLKETEQYDDTLIIFTSDNGGQANVGANNGSLRGEKQEVYEGGIRVPMCAVWTGKIKAGARSDRIAMSMDLFPSISDAAGAQFKHQIEGRTILPTLLGSAQPPEDRALFWSRREGGNRYMGKTIHAVRSGDWKLLHNSPYAPLELYNLKDDPQEQKNLAKSNGGKYNELARLLRAHIQRAGQVPWQRPK
jgi:arylsulfatase A-like enzyme